MNKTDSDIQSDVEQVPKLYKSISVYDSPELSIDCVLTCGMLFYICFSL